MAKYLPVLKAELEKMIDAWSAKTNMVYVWDYINNYDDYLYYKKERDAIKSMIDNSMKDKGEVVLLENSKKNRQRRSSQKGS